jgi:dual specificity MAP kinase phosphatase
MSKLAINLSTLETISNKNLRCDKSSSRFLMYVVMLMTKNVQFSDLIIDNIYLGNYVDSSSEEFIKQANINVIVNCTKDCLFYFNEQEVKYKYRIPVDDDRQENSLFIMFRYLSNIIDIIRFHVVRGDHIYIHCHAGMQRSACVVAAYLIRHYKMTPQEAVYFIRNKRPIAFTPFINFQKSLDNYYMKIKRETHHC